MNTLIFILSAFVLVISAGLFFGETTSAGASAGGYTAIPQAVRDFYSREVLFQAQPRLRFAQFAKVKRDLQAVRGKSIVFVKYGNLTGGGSLEESDVLTPEGMTTSEISIPVKEQANSVQVTEYLRGYGIEIEVYDKLYIDPADGKTKSFVPTGIVSAQSGGVFLGEYVFGRTPEERSGSLTDGNLSIVETGIAVYTYATNHPINTHCVVSMIGLPTFEGMDSVVVMKVKEDA